MAGLGFDYSSWIPGTTVTLVNVPWNNDYRDVPVFANRGALDSYIDGLGSNVRISELSYARPGNPIRLPIPLARAMKYNYLRAQNPAQHVSGDENTSWYYFITSVEHLSPGTTQITVQLDVMQSFLYDTNLRFGRSYIEAGHIGLCNAYDMSNRGRGFLSTPEGFDLGNEYQIDEIIQHNDGSTRVNSSVETDVNPNTQLQVIIMSTVDLNQSSGDENNPSLQTATGSSPQGGLPHGCDIYVAKTIFDFKLFLSDFAQKPWITQGIIGVWLFPHAYRIPVGELVPPGPASKYMQKIGYMPATPVIRNHGSNWRNTRGPGRRNPRYAHLNKFLTYPYSFWELTTNSGNPVIIKPESWQTDNLEIVALPNWAPPDLRITYYPNYYNAGLNRNTTWGGWNVFSGEALDMATSISNFPTFSVVNNSYMSFLAANKNTIAYQHQAADWSQQRALAGNEATFNNASMGMAGTATSATISQDLANKQASIAQTADAWNWGIGAVGGIVGGAANGGGRGLANGVGGAILSGAHTAVNVNARNEGVAASNQATRRSAANSNRVAGYTRDTNKQYADMAARGDYRMSIAAINAKVQDAKMIQPTTSGQVGGETNLVANYHWGYDLKFKMVNNNALAMIGEHWLRYGYVVNRYYSPGGYSGLHMMSHFTYWKMQECVIVSGGMPETFKQAMRGILEKGVTIWRDPDDIGVVDPGDNESTREVRI